VLLHLIKERRSIRRFKDRPVPHLLLDRVLEAACWAPSAHNRQPWRFVVVTGIGDKQRLAEAMANRLRVDLSADGTDPAAIDRDVGRSRQRLTNAPALIVVCLTMRDMDMYPDERRQACEHLMAAQSVAMAAQNLLLAAHAEGLGACWMCAPLFCPDTVRDALGLPVDYDPQGIIVLGFPAETRQKSREPLHTRVTFR
jgi:F420 biosynthesis protein FbiB-like protein